MIKKLKVAYLFKPQHSIEIGEMLRTERGAIYFQYEPSFLKSALSPSPIKLKSVAEPQQPTVGDVALFDGLFGAFADSLPDGWGLMMMSRAMRRNGIDFASTSALDRLSFVGSRGMGALVYQPEPVINGLFHGDVNLAQLAREVDCVLEGKTEDLLLELVTMGGSPGGARPKILIGVNSNGSKMISGVDRLPEDYEHWILKFRGKDENKHAGIVEFIYAETARHIGLNVPVTKLFIDSEGQHWFGTKRFDRGAGNTRIHMATAAGLLHANFRLPSLDYDDLLKMTDMITRREDDRRLMFRLAVFNAIFHNRDDHAKNFAFTMTEAGEWRLAPCYDLTYSPGPGGEHTTSYLGEGKSPTREHFVKLAEKHGIKMKDAKSIIEQVDDGREFMAKLMRLYEIKKHPISRDLRRK